MSTSFQMFQAMSNVVSGLTTDHFVSRLTVLLDLCVPSSLACWLVSLEDVWIARMAQRFTWKPLRRIQNGATFAAQIYLIGAPEPMSIEAVLAARTASGRVNSHLLTSASHGACSSEVRPGGARRVASGSATAAGP